MTSHLWFRKFSVLFVVFSLVFLQASSIFAVDEDVDSPTAEDTVDATQVMEEAAITFGQPIAEQLTLSGAKIAVQEDLKLVPTGTEAASTIDEKALNSIYLPLISETGNAAAVTSASADATNAPWFPILAEGFEGNWPHSLWQSFDNNGSFGGFYCWDDTNFFSYSGAWSGWPAKGCANGVDPTFFFYPHNLDSWTTYGPFSLVGAKQAQLKFRYWNNSERNHDWFWWCASGNGVNFGCKRVSGFNNWKNATLKLNSVPIWGDLRGDPTVWIAFIFTSDGSITSDGPFIDNIIVQAKF